MRIELERQVAYTDVNPHFRMTPRSLMRLLQEAAVAHSERVGVSSAALVAAGTVWVLNKIALIVRRWPVHRETLRIVTWHRGSRGFRAYRDFEVRAGGEPVAAATSLWLYFDQDAGRLRHVPPELSAAYTVEADAATEEDLEAWRPPTDFAVDLTVPITTRASDYDPLGHVNHTVYFDFIDTLVARDRPPAPILASLRIHYQKAIDRGVDRIEAALARRTGGGRFRLSADTGVFAVGDLTYPPVAAGSPPETA